MLSPNHIQSAACPPAPTAWQWVRALVSRPTRWRWFRGTRPETDPAAAIRAHFLPLETRIDEFRAFPAFLEQKFLAVGGALEGLPDASSEMVRHSEQLLTLTNGNESGASLLSATLGTLQAPLTFIEHSQQKTAELMEALAHSAAQIDRILASELLLQRTVAPLIYLRTMFRVESSQLSSELQAMFSALTEEISRLHGQVEETFGEKFGVLRSVRQVIQTVLEQAQTQARERDRLVAEKRANVEKIITGLHRDLERNEQRSSQLANVSRTVVKSVSRLVMGLQAQDMISQKAAHVTTALDVMREDVGAFESGREASRLAPLLQSLLGAARVEAAQLQAIRSDIAAAESDLVGAAREVQGAIERLDQECIHRFEREQSGASAVEHVQVLLDTLGDVQTLVDELITGTQQAHAAIQPIGGQTSNLTSTVRQLSAQIRLIGLNAQVQAALVGAGTGLEVLAASTTRVATETAEVSEAMAGELDGLIRRLDGMVAAFGQLGDEGVSQRRCLLTNSQGREAALHAFRDATLKELFAVGDTADQILVLVRRMDENARFASSADACLEPLCAMLGAIAASAQEALQTFPASSLPAGRTAGHELSRNYTMASERVIHEAALAGVALAPAAAASAETSVELFGDEPVVLRLADGTTGPSGVTAQPPKEDTTNVELF